jgi:hypothetical protein
VVVGSSEEKRIDLKNTKKEERERRKKKKCYKLGKNDVLRERERDTQDIGKTI